MAYKRFPDASVFVPQEFFIHESRHSLYVSTKRWAGHDGVISAPPDIVHVFTVNDGVSLDVGVACAELAVKAMNNHAKLTDACREVARSNQLGNGEPSIVISRRAYDAVIAALTELDGENG